MSESIARAKWVVRGVRNRQEAEIVEDGAVHQRDGTRSEEHTSELQSR